MEERQGSATVCQTCGDALWYSGATSHVGDGYTVLFHDICPRCRAVLIKAFAGVARAWSNEHGTAKERFFEALTDRLRENGFDPVEPFRPRPSGGQHGNSPR
jgi:hypothetical protein